LMKPVEAKLWLPPKPTCMKYPILATTEGAVIMESGGSRTGV
jgi:hypothetical protein